MMPPRRASSRAAWALTAMLLASVAVVVAPPANAAGSGGMGVTPAELRLTDPVLLPGGSYEGGFLMLHQQERTIEVTATPTGAVASWLDVAPAGPVLVAPGDRAWFTVQVTVPADASPGDHAGAVRFLAQSVADEGDSGSASSGADLAYELSPSVLLRVGGDGDEQRAFSLESVHLPDIVTGEPAQAVVDVVNKGNVPDTPRLLLRVLSPAGEVEGEAPLAAEQVAPGRGVTQTLVSDLRLPTGAYEARLALMGDDGNPEAVREGITFRVHASDATLPRGDPSAGSGEPAVGALEVDPTVRVGRPAKAFVAFTNSGTAAVERVVFQAEVWRNGERVEVIASEPMRVAPGKTAELAAFWTPTEAGLHGIRAWVVHDGSTSPTQEAVLEVAAADPGLGGGAVGGQGEAPGGSPVPGPGAVAVLALLALAALGLGMRRRG